MSTKGDDSTVHYPKYIWAEEIVGSAHIVHPAVQLRPRPGTRIVCGNRPPPGYVPDAINEETNARIMMEILTAPEKMTALQRSLLSLRTFRMVIRAMNRLSRGLLTIFTLLLLVGTIMLGRYRNEIRKSQTDAIQTPQDTAELTIVSSLYKVIVGCYVSGISSGLAAIPVDFTRWRGIVAFVALVVEICLAIQVIL